MIQEFENELGNRLLKYAAIDSQSNEDSATTPSTPTASGLLTAMRAIRRCSDARWLAPLHDHECPMYVL